MDVFAQREEIDRRKKLYETLQAQSMQQPIQASGTGNGLAQVLMKLGTAYLTSKGQKANAEESSTNNAAYQSQLGQELKGYMDRSNGAPGEQMNTQQVSDLLHNDQAPQLADPVKADPKAALVAAMTSRFPEMQKVGAVGMANMGKPSEETFGQPQLVRGADGSMQNVLVGNRGTVKPMQGYSPAIKQEATAGGNLFDPYAGSKTGFVGSTYGAPTEAGGAIVQANNDSGKLDQVVGRPPTTTVTNTVHVAGQKAGFDEWAKGAAKTVGELSEGARSSTRMLSQLNQLEGLNAAGTMNGPLANPAVWLGQLASSAGVPISKETQAKLGNSETFGNTAAELWLASMNANGGSRGLVKEESERIAKNLPSLLQTPEGRSQVITVMRQAAQQNIADAKTSQQEFSKALQSQNPSAFTYGLSNTQLPNTTPTTPPPGSVAPNAGGVRNWKDYLGGQ